MNTNRTRRDSLILLAGLFLGALAAYGYISVSQNLSGSSASGISEVRDSGYKFINPLLECEFGQSALSKELQSFQKELSDFIQGEIAQNKAASVAVYFRDLNNGPWIGIHGDMEFIPASLLKVPIMISYYKAAETDPSVLDKKITYEAPSNQNVPYFKGSQQIEVGKTYSVEELIEHMIVYSDNEAQNLLVANSAPGQLDRVFDDLGVHLPADKIVLTVRQYASFFRILFNASYLTREYSEKSLSLLSQTEFKDGLSAGLPSNTQIAQKFGEKWSNPNDAKQLHDCGIIYFPQHPYLLCVMTRGDDFHTLATTIADISRFTYQQIDKQF